MFPTPSGGHGRSKTTSQPNTPPRETSPPTSPTSAKNRLNRSASFPTPMSTHRPSGESLDEVGPLPPSPLRIEGYLKKLKSEEGTFAGGLFQRSKFNKRWFAIDEIEQDGATGAGVGHLYEIKYWKVASDAGTKLPGFILDLDLVLGCEEGVGLGPFTREPHTFHIETQARTYVLTAASREEMLWWISGVKYYTWNHQQTRARMDRRAKGVASPTPPPASAVVSSSSKNDFGVIPNPNRRRSLPLQDLGSPVSSSDGSTFGSPSPGGVNHRSPLPSFSPLANDSPSAIALVPPFGERVVVQLKDYESTGRTPREDAGGLMDSQEMERKYDEPNGNGKLSSVVRPNKPGELSAPIRFDHPDVVTARPMHQSNVNGASELSSPIRFGHPDVETARPANDGALQSHRSDVALQSQRSEDDPFHGHHSPAKDGSNNQPTNASAYPSLLSDRSDKQSARPDLDDLLSPHLSDASAPPQTTRPGVGELLSPHLAGASAPPQTERPGVDPRLVKAGIGSAVLQAGQHPPVNPHAATAMRHSIDSLASDRSDKLDLGATAQSGFPVVDAGGLATEREQEESISTDPFDAHHEEQLAEESIREDILESLEPDENPLDSASSEPPHQLDASLDAADESILNGSDMLAESMAPEEALNARKRQQVPVEVPRLNAPTPAAAAAVANNKLPPLVPPSQLLQPSATPPQPPATPMEVVQAISQAPAHAPPAAVVSKFSPSKTDRCNTAEDFSALRQELRSYSLDRMLADQLAAGWFIRSPSDGVIRISAEAKPFNPFARLVTGALPAPYGNLLVSAGLQRYDDRFFVALNRPELNEKWNSSDPEWVGKASMGEKHQFLLIKSLAWETFNVATFGMKQQTSATPSTVDALKDGIELLNQLETVAREYTQAKGWSPRLGLFFHVYPFNSVQALHLHMLDMDSVGPTFHYLNYKNLPLQAAREVLQQELNKIAPPVPARPLLAPLKSLGLASRSATGASATATSNGTQPESSPAYVTVQLKFDLDYTQVTRTQELMATFSQGVAREISGALNLPSPRSIEILSISPGSVIVNMRIHAPNGGATATQLLSELKDQSRDLQSKLMQGEFGRTIKGVTPISSIETTNAVVETKPEPIQPARTAPAAISAPTPIIAPVSSSVPPSSSSSNWQNDLSSLLNQGKLPYEDVPTQRIAIPPPAPKDVAHVRTIALSATPVDVPISQCDACYTSITSHTSSQSSYCWTCHLVHCQRCTANHNRQNGKVHHVVEGLDGYIGQSKHAYCSRHANAGPGAQCGAVRPRALRFSSLFSHWCETCQKLVCPQCRQDDGIHYQNSSHVLRSISDAANTHARTIQTTMQTTVIPVKSRMEEALTKTTVLQSQSQNDAATLKQETFSYTAKCVREATEHSLSAQREVDRARTRIHEDLRKVEQLDSALSFNASSVASSHSGSIASSTLPPSTASMLALLSSREILLDAARSLNGPSNPSSDDDVSSAIAEVQQAQARIVSSRKEKDEQLKALPALQAGIAAKDRDLQAILASRRGLLAESAKQAESLNSLYEKAHAEIQEWMALTEGMSRQIAAFKQTCQYCGVALSGQAANARCTVNRASGVHAFTPVLTQQIIQ